MTTALQTAEQHLAELAANGVPARDKPSAFHHGLIVTLVADSRLCQLKLDGEEAIRRGAFEKINALKQRIDATEKELHASIAKLNHLRTIALDWYHGEDCGGYGMEADPEWDECDCGVGDVIRGTSPAGIEVYIDRTTERYGLSRILEPKAAR